ncbi:MAG: hypothetical protein NTW28_21685 [Candidatus Solibacter sp.]|nr:hypothetical protein [Candidatus Solibacter sp.]
MRVPVGSDGWYLSDWSDHPDFEYTEFRGGKTLAVQWASQFRGDFFALRTLRSLVGGTFPPRGDEQIAQEVACRLTSGAWVARRRVVKMEAAIGGSLPEAAVAFPKEERRPAPPPPRTPGPDAPLFPGDIDPAAIAEAQKEAAALGVPFCEECLKAQMAAR